MHSIGKTSLVLLLLVLAASSALADDRGLSRVEAVVTIRFEPDSQAVVWPEVKAILESSPRDGWSGDVPAALADAPETYRSVGVVREETDDPGVLSVRVVLVSKASGVRADHLLDALVRRLGNHLREQYQQEREAMGDEALLMQKRLEEITKNIEAIRGEGALPWPLSAASFFETLIERQQDLRARLSELALEEKALKARRGALVERLAIVTKQDRKDRDAAMARLATISQSLDSIVNARALQLDAVKQAFENGVATPEEVSEAEAVLAAAKLQRAEALMDFSPAPRSAKREEIELTVAALAIDQAVLDATRDHLQQMKAELEQDIAQRRGAILPVTHLEEESQAFRDRLLGLTQALSVARPPRVSVLRLD